MNKRLSKFSKKQALVYKVFLFIASTLLVIYFLPRGGQFKYDFQKGKPWQYENLYAPFSFTIKKSEEAIENERAELRKLATPYFDFDSGLVAQNKTKFRQLLNQSYVDTLYSIRESTIYDIGSSIIDRVNNHGITGEIHAYSQDQLVYLKNGNEVDEITYGQILKQEELDSRVRDLVNEGSNSESVRNLLEILLKRSISPNVIFNNKLTEAAIASELKDISPNRGIIEKDGRIIAKGEVVEGDTFQILNSLKAEYQSQVWSESNRIWLLIGYALLVSLVFLMLFLFLNKYRKEIYSNNTKVTFIFFNVVLMVFLTTFIVKLDAAFVYVVPLCVLPLILKAFFDPRLGLFVHVLTLLLVRVYCTKQF